MKRLLLIAVLFGLGVTAYGQTMEKGYYLYIKAKEDTSKTVKTDTVSHKHILKPIKK